MATIVCACVSSTNRAKPCTYIDAKYWKCTHKFCVWPTTKHQLTFRTNDISWNINHPTRLHFFANKYTEHHSLISCLLLFVFAWNPITYHGLDIWPFQPKVWEIFEAKKKESTRKVKNVEFWRKLKSLISFETLSIIDKLHCMKSECLHLMHQWWLNAWYNKTGDYLIVFITVCLARKVLGKRYKNQTQSLFYCPGIDNAEWQSMCNRIEKLKCCQSLREFAILYIMESMPNVNFILKCNKRFGIGVVTVTVKLTQK